MNIQIQQSPLTITPSNGEHIYTLATTGMEYNLPNFKYVVDVYFRPSTIDFSQSIIPNPAARLKVRPNSYGKAIIELKEIIRTFLKANPRFSGETYPYLNYVAEENSIITMSDAQHTRTYNAFNLWESGGVNQNLSQLWHIEQYQIKVGYEYQLGTNIVTEIVYTDETQPPPVNIFPGVDNNLIPEPYLSGATLGGTYNQSPNFFQVDNQSWLYYDLFRHIYQTGEDISCGPREFLNAAGRKYKTISQPDFVSQKVRTRQHHPDCPIIMSFLDGQNDYFNNQTGSLVIRSAINKSDPYTYSAVTLNNSTQENVWDLFKMGVFYLPYNVTSGETLNAIPVNSKKVCFYLTETPNDISFSARTSEVMEFDIQDKDCINEPIHLLFLNGRGQWDTYTFSKKSTKNIQVDRKKYQEEASLNKSFYARGSSQRGQSIYEQIADYEISCSSWYMTENDVTIVEELFMSPEVYMISGTTITDADCISCLEEIRLYQHLIPVVINEKTFEVYKKQYKKLYQYEFTLSYGGVKRFSTQG